ncbi:MAG: DsbA family protein [Maricaulaceae bacterium]|nr:DsbA family protein [Maricaulaceae bacterium]
MFNMKALAGGIALAAALFLQAPAGAQEAPVMGDLAFGAADAPVTVIEYASFTCPHCAAFHAETWPRLKEHYVQTGKVRFIFRDFPLDEPALRASMLARCAGAGRYYSFVEVIFSQQLNWARSPDPVAALGQLAKLGGIGEAEFRACMANKTLEDAILKMRLDGANEYKINSTPSFVIGGKVHPGALPFAEMEKLINAQAASPAAGSGGASAGVPVWGWLAGGAGLVVVLGGIAVYLRRRASA